MLNGTMDGPSLPIWINAPMPQVSEAGLIVDDFVRTYRWPVYWSSHADYVLMTIRDYELSDNLYAEWHVEVYKGSIVIDEGWFYALSPVQGFQGTAWNFRSIPYPSGGFTTGLFLFRCATYAQGGSPWL